MSVTETTAEEREPSVYPAPVSSVTLTVLSDSSSSSSSVCNDSVLLLSPAAKANVDGAVSQSTLPVSETATATDSTPDGAESRLTVNVAASPSVTGLVPAETVTSGSGVSATTATDTTSSSYSLPASVTRSLKVRVASSISSVGAAKVVVADDAADSVTVGPPVWVHAYVSVSPASGSSPAPLSVTVAPSSMPTWSSPAAAVGASFRLDRVTRMFAVSLL